MTNLKAVLAATAISSLIVIAFGYASKSKKATVTYYFDCSVGLIRGPLNGTNLLVQSEVKMIANWVTTVHHCYGGDYLCGIMFDQESGNVSDGIADGQYSLQEAIDQVFAEYIRSSQFTLPSHNNSFTPAISGASAITILRASSNSCP